MHRRERHPRYIRSFVGFWDGIRKLSGDMKLIFFALVSSPMLFCCSVVASFGCNSTYWEVAGRNGDHQMC